MIKIQEIVFHIIIIIIIIIFILLIFGLILGPSVPSEYCKMRGGEFVYHECQSNAISGVFCSNVKTGYWCELSDGTSLNETEIWRIVNLTN